LYVSDKSLDSTPETNVTLYANWNLNKNLRKKNHLSPIFKLLVPGLYP